MVHRLGIAALLAGMDFAEGRGWCSERLRSRSGPTGHGHQPSRIRSRSARHHLVSCFTGVLAFDPHSKSLPAGAARLLRQLESARLDLLHAAPGDTSTYGASELFGGRIASTTIERGRIQFHVNSLLDVVNEYVPTNVIELLNTAAAYAGATPPAGFSDIPQFSVVTGDSTTQVNGDCTNIGPHHIFSTNALQHGYLVFNEVPGATLGGVGARSSRTSK